MFRIILVILVIFIIVCLWVMLYDTHHFVVRKYTVSSPKILKETRLVMLSDLHNYRYGEENAVLLAAINKENPDMVVCAGDMITAKAGENMKGSLALMQALSDRYPFYYAYGNHENKIRLIKKCGDMVKEFDEGLKEKKIMPFLDARTDFADRGITLYGLHMEQTYFKRVNPVPMEADYMEKHLGKCGEDTFSVLLAHNPEYFPNYAKWGADLTLAGHMHGGIVRLPYFGGLIAPSLHFFPKYDGGFFTEGEKKMIVGRGIGTHSPRVRLFNPAELVVVELKPEAPR